MAKFYRANFVFPFYVIEAMDDATSQPDKIVTPCERNNKFIVLVSPMKSRMMQR